MGHSATRGWQLLVITESKIIGTIADAKLRHKSNCSSLKQLDKKAL